MTTMKTLNTEIVTSYLSFLPVTHMVTTDVQFDSYEFSKTGHGAELSGQNGHRREFSGLEA
jgi:hypothetical protein